MIQALLLLLGNIQFLNTGISRPEERVHLFPDTVRQLVQQSCNLLLAGTMAGQVSFCSPGRAGLRALIGYGKAGSQRFGLRFETGVTGIRQLFGGSSFRRRLGWPRIFLNGRTFSYFFFDRPFRGRSGRWRKVL